MDAQKFLGLFKEVLARIFPPSTIRMLSTNDLLQRIPTGSRLRLLLCAQITILSPNRSQSSFNYSYPNSRQICDSSLHLKLVA